MAKAIIKISYRQVLTAADTDVFAKRVIDASFNEFLLKSQAYDPEGKFHSFTELKANDGRANSLHYKTGFAVDGFIGQLNHRIPQLINTQNENIVFENYRFELLESNIYNKLAHSVAIHYITENLTLLDSFGDQLLVAYGDTSESSKTAPVENCFLLPLQTNLSIIQYQSA